MPPTRVAWGATFALALAVFVLLAQGHRDDSDDQLYRVVARHLVEDGTWLELRYLPNVHPHFREHLPFGLWPTAAAIRSFGERAAWVPNAFFALGLLAIVGAVGRRAGGDGVALVAMLALATCESVAIAGSTTRLDAPLLFFAWAAAAPLLLGPPTRARFAFAGVAAALAVAVKGPFGLLPLLAVSAVCAWEARRLGPALAGGAVALAAVLPVATFLWVDRTFSGGSWWRGYVEAQLIASAVGARSDGSTNGFLYPFVVVAGRFWPGLPLALVGGWVAVRRRALDAAPQRFALLSALLLGALCLPQRKLWNHALIAFPALALLAGVGARSLGEQLGVAARAKWGSRARTLLLGSAAVAWVAVAVGVGARIWLGRCLPSAPGFAERFPQGPGTRVAVVTPVAAWGTLAALAAERRWVPWLLAPGEPLDASAFALAVFHPDAGAPPLGWRLIEEVEARGWRVAEPSQSLR